MKEFEISCSCGEDSIIESSSIESAKCDMQTKVCKSCGCQGKFGIDCEIDDDNWKEEAEVALLTDSEILSFDDDI